MLGFEIFDQIFQTTNLALQAIKYFKYDSGFDLFDLRAALQRPEHSIIKFMPYWKFQILHLLEKWHA